MTEPTFVDARGLRCPMPVIELQRLARRLPPGSLVRLVSDDPAAASDVAAWCRMQGHALVETEQDGAGVGTYLVRLSPAQ